MSDTRKEIEFALARITALEAENARMREACDQGRLRADNFLKGLRFAPVERTDVTVMVDSMIQALRFDFEDALGIKSAAALATESEGK